MLAVGFEPTSGCSPVGQFGKRDSLACLSPPRLPEVAIGSTSTSVRDHPASVFGAPIPFSATRAIFQFAAERSLAQFFKALLESLLPEAREGGRKRKAWDEGEAAIPGGIAFNHVARESGRQPFIGYQIGAVTRFAGFILLRAIPRVPRCCASPWALCSSPTSRAEILWLRTL